MGQQWSSLHSSRAHSDGSAISLPSVASLSPVFSPFPLATPSLSPSGTLASSVPLSHTSACPPPPPGPPRLQPPPSPSTGALFTARASTATPSEPPRPTPTTSSAPTSVSHSPSHQSCSRQPTQSARWRSLAQCSRGPWACAPSIPRTGSTTATTRPTPPAASTSPRASPTTRARSGCGCSATTCARWPTSPARPPPRRCGGRPRGCSAPTAKRWPPPSGPASRS
mmetsp:Transcript_18168/g.70247  ORF Transcript_18168/g.70247 Transcript_18168/m.70247 type:complete len:225 (-) Transcript_18168:139-813(-)